MRDPEIQSDDRSSSSTLSGGYTPRLPFSEAAPGKSSSRGRIIGAVASIALLSLVASGFILTSGKTAAPAPQNVVLPADPYASHLAFTKLAMSESTSLSGGKSTFIDGYVRNTGADILTDVTVQVLFRNDVGLAPQIEKVPLTLIRTHEPYIDIQPVTAAPLKPGDDAEFRLIFETVAGSWNQQMPDMLVVRVKRR